MKNSLIKFSAQLHVLKEITLIVYHLIPSYVPMYHCTVAGIPLVVCVPQFDKPWFRRYVHYIFCMSVCFITLYNSVCRGLTYLYLKHADASQKYYTAVYRSRQEPSKPGLFKVRTVLFWGGTFSPCFSTQLMHNDMLNLSSYAYLVFL
jgi:hypothetical protein